METAITNITEEFVQTLNELSKAKDLTDPWSYGPLVVMCLFYTTFIVLFLFAVFFNFCRSGVTPKPTSQTNQEN